MKAAIGTIVSLLVLTAAPAEVEPRVVLARALVAALRAELDVLADGAGFATRKFAALGDPSVAAALTVPAGAFELAVPLGGAPAVLTYRSRKVREFCRSFGATSIIT